MDYLCEREEEEVKKKSHKNQVSSFKEKKRVGIFMCGSQHLLFFQIVISNWMMNYIQLGWSRDQVGFVKKQP